MSKAIKTLLPLLALAGLGVVVAALAGAFESPSHGPVPIVWDREVCAECRMHIGDPAYAAQVQTEAGQVFNFDDPGCLFRYLSSTPASVEAIYFHHVHEDRWLARDEVGFIAQPQTQTPMGWGLGAVERDFPGAIGFDQAARQVASGPPSGGAR